MKIPHTSPAATYTQQNVLDDCFIYNTIGEKSQNESSIICDFPKTKTRKKKFEIRTKIRGLLCSRQLHKFTENEVSVTVIFGVALTFVHVLLKLYKCLRVKVTQILRIVTRKAI